MAKKIEIATSRPLTSAALVVRGYAMQRIHTWKDTLRWRFTVHVRDQRNNDNFQKLKRDDRDLKLFFASQLIEFDIYIQFYLCILLFHACLCSPPDPINLFSTSDRVNSSLKLIYVGADYNRIILIHIIHFTWSMRSEHCQCTWDDEWYMCGIIVFKFYLLSALAIWNSHALVEPPTKHNISGPRWHFFPHFTRELSAAACKLRDVDCRKTCETVHITSSKRALCKGFLIKYSFANLDTGMKWKRKPFFGSFFIWLRYTHRLFMMARWRFNSLRALCNLENFTRFWVN